MIPLVEENDLLVTVGGSIIYNGQLYLENSDVERISVVGSNISRVDLESSTGGIVVTAADLDRLPVESGFESIALIISRCYRRIVNLAQRCIGGSSSAENFLYT